ncbi:MAG: DNA adenine methylase [Verrucomicrobia bacterium]|nr:DNA adenine methylase [Verrucomicrobiota bacterium]MCH8511725.1 DNA adenine methylase [Kiritimatiellia bacterium]
MKIPQPFQYQGSKRALATTILQYLPHRVHRIVEPFAGSAAFSLACAARGKAKEYWLNDFNKPLAQLIGLIVNQPEEVSEFYKSTWRSEDQEPLEHYYQVREEFNRTNDPKLLLYLLARCVKASVRYNSDGLFNQSPDKRRLGTHPDRMKNNILGVSMLLRGKTIVTAQDYRDVLANCRDEDVVYMDPPYQGVCGERDARYVSGISFDDFVVALDQLNARGVRYMISYDGRLGEQSYGEPLPDYLDLTLVEIEAGRSSQATLLGRKDVTFESLYLSQTLSNEMSALPCTHYRANTSQMQLLEPTSPYGKIPQRVSTAL